jgi:hypothetical protein
MKKLEHFLPFEFFTEVGSGKNGPDHPTLITKMQIIEFHGRLLIQLLNKRAFDILSLKDAGISTTGKPPR